jgi:hypothetical protein
MRVSLPSSAIGKAAILVVSMIIVIAAVGYSSFLLGLSTHPLTTTSTQTQTMTSQETYTLTNTQTLIRNVTTTNTTTLTVTRYNATSFPFDYPLYLSSSCAASGPLPNGTVVSEPCSSNDLSSAYVFNCLAAAASPSGCTQNVTSSLIPSSSYSITIWYPYASPPSSNRTWANCMDVLDGKYYPSYDYCITVSPEGFILSQPGGPPL